MDTLKLNPKILAAVFASVAVIADLIPAPNLGPGLIISSYNWVALKVHPSMENHQVDQEMRATQSRQPAYNQ